MKERDEAKTMLVMAEKDFKALRNMLDIEVFADEIFGFHAQQAIEKLLKAWIAATGNEYPQIHDIGNLLLKLKKLDIDVSSFADYVDFTDYAVQFRYLESDYTDDPLDRRDTIIKVRTLYDRVKGIIETYD